MSPTLGPLSYKWTHFLAFAVLALLLRLAYRISSIQTTAVLLFYALFIEFSQYFTPNRCAEALDVVADVIGIAIGLLLYWIVQRWIDEVY
jgi:VanZ family protein